MNTGTVFPGPLQHAGYISMEKTIRVEMVLHLVKCLPLIPFKLKSLSLSPWRCQCHPERWMRGAYGEGELGGNRRTAATAAGASLIRADSLANILSLYLVTFIYPGTVDWARLLSFFATFSLAHGRRQMERAPRHPSCVINTPVRTPLPTEGHWLHQLPRGLNGTQKNKIKKSYFSS